jgi:hypothetical protein
MSRDIEVIWRGKINLSRKFSLQINEFTDIAGHAQLIASIRYIDGNNRKELPERATGDERFRVTSIYAKMDYNGRTVLVSAQIGRHQ